jgi:hypothetical protein
MPFELEREMTARLWFPQLDVYDTIRRMACLLSGRRAIGLERLYILDFFLANPPLLHRTHMPREVRDEFTKLKIPRPENTFLSYPSAPILFHKMEGIQKEAVQTLLGKGLIDRVQVTKGEVIPSPLGESLFGEQLSRLITQSEQAVLEFLLIHFRSIGDNDIETFRRSSSLRRVG